MAFQNAEISAYLKESQRKVWANSDRGRHGCMPKTMVDDGLDPVQIVRDGFTRAVESGSLIKRRKKK